MEKDKDFWVAVNSKPKNSNVYDFSKTENPVYNEIIELIGEKNKGFIPTKEEEMKSFLYIIKQNKENEQKYNQERENKKRKFIENQINVSNSEEEEEEEYSDEYNFKKSKSSLSEYDKNIDPETLNVSKGLMKLSNFHLGNQEEHGYVDENEYNDFPSSDQLFKKSQSMNIGAGFDEITVKSSSLTPKYMETLRKEYLGEPVDVRKNPLIRKDGSFSKENDELIYGIQWVNDFLEAQENLRQSEDYQFLYSLAGATNTVVDRLYVVDDIDTKQLRAQLISQQKSEEIKSSVKQIDEKTKKKSNLQKEKLDLELELKSKEIDFRTIIELNKIFESIQTEEKKAKVYYFSYLVLDKIKTLLQYFKVDDDKIVLKEEEDRAKILEIKTDFSSFFNVMKKIIKSDYFLNVSGYPGEYNNLEALIYDNKKSKENQQIFYFWNVKKIEKEITSDPNPKKKKSRTKGSLENLNIDSRNMTEIHNFLLFVSYILSELYIYDISQKKSINRDIQRKFKKYINSYIKEGTINILNIFKDSNIRTSEVVNSKKDVLDWFISQVYNLIKIVETTYKGHSNNIKTSLNKSYQIFQNDPNESKSFRERFGVNLIQILSNIAKISNNPSQFETLGKYTYSGFYIFLKEYVNNLSIDTKFSEKIKNEIKKLNDDINDIENAINYDFKKLTSEVPEIPYRHDAEWVLRPEFTGRITMEPIVRNAINQAYSNTLRKYMPHLSKAQGNSAAEKLERKHELEKLMFEPDYQPHFVLLVAAHMLGTRQQFQTRWTPDLSQERIRMIDSALNSLEMITGIPRQTNFKRKFRNGNSLNDINAISSILSM